MRTQLTTVHLPRLAAVLMVLAALLLNLLAGPHVATAEDIETVPETVACVTPPIDAARYAEAALDTGDDVGVPDPIPYAPPTGTTAGALVIGRVEATLGQVVACVDEGRTVAFLNLFTTAWLSTHVGSLGELPDDIAPTPIAAEEHLSLVEVADVVVLADGRVAALVVFDQSERTGPELTSVMAFTDVDGALRIDDWQPVTLPEGGGATPVPAPCAGEAADDPGCAPTPAVDTPVAGGWEVVSGEVYTGVIAPADQAVAFDYYLAVEPSGYWTPEAAQIVALEAGLPAYLGTFWTEPAAGLADDLSGYTRQYAGLVIDGRALIYVNAFCQNPRDDDLWRSTALFNSGGGACYVQLFYEPATGRYYDLRINEDT